MHADRAGVAAVGAGVAEGKLREDVVSGRHHLSLEQH